jgi:hypothetical protein
MQLFFLFKLKMELLVLHQILLLYFLHICSEYRRKRYVIST